MQEIMPTNLKKRRVIYVDDQIWKPIEYLEGQLGLRKSEIVRRLFIFIKKFGGEELKEIVLNKYDGSNTKV
jgi:hypothetical protein